MNHQHNLSGQCGKTPAAAGASPYARFKIDLDRLLPRYDMTWRYPAMPVDWMTGAPIGNGDFGATIHGVPDGLTFTFAKTNVWQHFDSEGDAFIAPFAEFRRICETQDEAAFARLAQESAAKFPGKDPHLTTCGALRLRLNVGMNPNGLDMRVRLRDATMQMTLCKHYGAVVTAFVSHAYDVLAVEIDRGELFRHSSWFCWPDFVPFESLPWEFVRPDADHNHPNPPPSIERAGDDYLCTQSVGRGESFTLGIRFVNFAQADHATFPNQISGRLRQPTGRKVYLFATIVSSREAADTRGKCRERLSRAVQAGFATIYQVHAEHWNAFWMRGLVSVGDEGLEKMYYRSLYLCGSMLRPGCQSPGLTGVWAGEASTPWNADYHANINIQAIYWGLFTNNRLDLLEPYLRLYEGFAAHGREVASTIFGMRGLQWPFAATIDGPQPGRINWFGCSYDPSCTAWLAQLFWRYFEYSQDRQWLKETGYPLLRDVARFLSDYLIRNPVSGTYDIMPSVSHEAGKLKGFGRNAHYAIAWFRAGFRQAVQAAGTLGVDEIERAEWQERLDHLAEPPIENGLFKRMEDEPLDANGTNVMGWLTVVYPAELVSRFHGPERWRHAALASWEHTKRLNQDPRAWCGGIGISDILRLGDVERTVQEARWPGNKPTIGNFNIMQENGFTMGTPGEYIQVDHTPGMCSVLADMMLMGLDGVIHLFPGIPSEMPARFHNLRMPGGFVLCGEKRGREVDYVIVTPTAPASFRLANPWPDRPVVVTDLGNGAIVADLKGAELAAELTPGRSYGIVPAGHRLDDLPVAEFACQPS